MKAQTLHFLLQALRKLAPCNEGKRTLKGTLKLAFKLLVNDTAKFTALLMGITFAVFL